MPLFSKKENKKQKEIETQILKEANKNYVPTLIVLDKIIEFVEKDLENFVPSIGNKTLADIDVQAKQSIRSVQNSREYAALMQDKERKVELKEVILQLSKVRATKWDSQAFFATSLIKSKVKFLRNDPINKDVVEEIDNGFKWN